MELSQIASYLISWRMYDFGETIDRDVYGRFLDWIDQPQIVKPHGWRGRHRFSFQQFVKHMTELAHEGFLIKKSSFDDAVMGIQV